MNISPIKALLFRLYMPTLIRLPVRTNITQL